MTLRRGRVAACGLVLALLGGACNSTARLGADAGEADESFDVASDEAGILADDGAAATSSTIPADAPAAAGGAGPVGGPRVGQGATVTTVGPTAGSEAAGTAAGAIPMGTGVTDSEILIGIEVTRDINQATATVGARTNNPEEINVARAVVKHINENGGIAGRQVRAVYQEKDTTRGTWEQHAATACAAFTEDNHVFAAISSSVGGNEALASCLAQRGVPLVETNFWPFDSEAYRRLGHFLYQPSRMSADRAMAVYVDGLQSLRYFNDAKVGLIGFDEPVFRRMAGAIKAKMADHGLSVTDEQTVLTPHGVADFGALGTQIGNAIVSFRSKGVTHVVFAEYAGILPFLFLAAADSQGFEPRYGFNSLNRANTQASQSSAEQMHEAVNVGWLPADDVSFTEEYRGGSYAACLEIGRRESVGGSDNGPRLYMGIFCDAMFFLDAALDSAAALTPAGLEESVHRLGTGYDSPATYGTRFFPGRHDGAAAVRYTIYDADCGCMVYANDRVDQVA